MIYTIIIVLIGILIIAAIAATAVQQHRAAKESKKREEVNRLKLIIEEAEGALNAASRMPVSQQLVSILYRRILSALKEVTATTSHAGDVNQRIQDTIVKIKSININEPAPDHNTFKLPKSDKVIIKYIQAVKKLRAILRSEQTKAHITPKTFAYEDKQLERLQLRVNVATLEKRANDAKQKNMIGSSRSYLEKALAVLKKQKPQDEFTVEKARELEVKLENIESDMKVTGAESVAKASKETEDLDQLFAPKKKW